MGKSKKAKKENKAPVLSKKELKAQAKAAKVAAKAEKKSKKTEPIKEPVLSKKELKAQAKAGKSDKKGKKVKTEKKPKEDAKSAKGSKEVLDTTNVFTAVGLALTHRAKPFQLVRHYDEVTVESNKVAFPYQVETMSYGQLCAVLVLKGQVHAFTRTGAPFNNLGKLMHSFKNIVLRDGIYICELYVPQAITSTDKLAAMVSPFRKNILTKPQQLIANDETRLAVCDYLTIEEFTEGKAEMLRTEREERLTDSIDFNADTRIHMPDSKKVKDMKGLLKFFNKQVKSGAEGVTIKGNDRYVCGHQNFHFMSMLPYIKAKLECTGFMEGTGKLVGQVDKLIFKGKDGAVVEAALGDNYSEEDSIAMLKTCKHKKKKGAPMGFVFDVYALEQSTKGVLKNPKVGNFTKDKADF